MPTLSISISTLSPGFIHTGGVRRAPTPPGVPVTSTSPGARVVHAETYSMIFGILKIIWSVLACCICSPFSRQLSVILVPGGISSVGGDGSFFASIAGHAAPTGFEVVVALLATGTVATLASIAVFPFALWNGGLAAFSPRLLPAAVGVAMLSSALPYTLEMHALRLIPERTFSILMSLEPAVAALPPAVQ